MDETQKQLNALMQRLNDLERLFRLHKHTRMDGSEILPSNIKPRVVATTGSAVRAPFDLAVSARVVTAGSGCGVSISVDNNSSPSTVVGGFSGVGSVNNTNAFAFALVPKGWYYQITVVSGTLSNAFYQEL